MNKDKISPLKRRLIQYPIIILFISLAFLYVTLTMGFRGIFLIMYIVTTIIILIIIESLHFFEKK